MSTQSTPSGVGSPFRHAQQLSPWDELLRYMSETEAGGLLVDLQEALNRASHGSAFLLEGRALNGRVAFTAESLKALNTSTLRPEDYGRVKVLGAASPFKGEYRSPSSSAPPPFPLSPPSLRASGQGGSGLNSAGHSLLGDSIALWIFGAEGGGVRCACPAYWLSPLRKAANCPPSFRTVSGVAIGECYSLACGYLPEQRGGRSQRL